MHATRKLRWSAAVLTLVVAGVGCNPLTLPFFMMYGVESKVEPDFRLAVPDKEVKVVVLAYSAPDVQTDQVGIDRQIGSVVAKQLAERCLANKEKVKVVPVHKVEKFKSDHPGWKTMGAVEIGKQFEADFVIDIEVVGLNLYEPGSHKSLYRGRCKIDLAVFDVRKPHDGAVIKPSMTIDYPTKARGPIPVMDDNNTEKFRDGFVNRIATDVCWKLTSHLYSEEYQLE
ncbi:MAG: hypothetical protein U0746_01505 [Gemmataceae bacterium]